MPADIKDYLEASADASKRTITIVIVMVVASVVVFTGLLNSSQSQWMGLRMRGLADVRSHYTQSSLGHYPERQNFRNDQEFNDAKRMFESRYLELSEGVVKAYLDTLSIHVPFFGFSFDMNDLGLLGGIGLVVILTCYRFFLSRELNNLQMSFEEARKTRYGSLCGVLQAFGYATSVYDPDDEIYSPFQVSGCNSQATNVVTSDYLLGRGRERRKNNRGHGHVANLPGEAFVHVRVPCPDIHVDPLFAHHYPADSYGPSLGRLLGRSRRLRETFGSHAG
jgi:uncharacterized membrane protein